MIITCEHPVQSSQRASRSQQGPDKGPTVRDSSFPDRQHVKHSSVTTHTSSAPSQTDQAPPAADVIAPTLFVVFSPHFPISVLLSGLKYQKSIPIIYPFCPLSCLGHHMSDGDHKSVLHPDVVQTRHSSRPSEDHVSQNLWPAGGRGLA